MKPFNDLATHFGCGQVRAGKFVLRRLGEGQEGQASLPIPLGNMLIVLGGNPIVFGQRQRGSIVIVAIHCMFSYLVLYVRVLFVTEMCFPF